MPVLNKIWADALVLSALCIIMAFIFFYLAKGLKARHERKGTTPIMSIDNPDYARNCGYIFILLAIYVIGKAIFKSLT